MSLDFNASTKLKSAGYSSEFEILEVEFHNGSIYQFYDVPEIIYTRMMKEKSKSEYFGAHIRNTYPFSRTG